MSQKSIFAVLLAMLAGCATTTQRWGEWQQGPWTGNGEQRASSVTVTSVPEQAQVVVDGRHAGDTPLALPLPYGVEERIDQRTQYLDRTGGLGQIGSAVLGLCSLGSIKVPARVRTQPLNRETRAETRAVSQTHSIAVTKPGYFPESFQIAVPGAEGQTYAISLRAQEVLIVEPVDVVEGIQREAGFFSWLKYKFLGRYGIARDQYPVVAERVGRALEAHAAETGLFRSISVCGERQKVEGAAAQLSIEIQLYEDRVVLQGTLASPSLLGARTVTRQVETPTSDFLANLFAVCGRLTQELTGVYTASLPGGVETALKPTKE